MFDTAIHVGQMLDEMVRRDEVESVGSGIKRPSIGQQYIMAARLGRLHLLGIYVDPEAVPTQELLPPQPQRAALGAAEVEVIIIGEIEAGQGSPGRSNFWLFPPARQ